MRSHRWWLKTPVFSKRERGSVVDDLARKSPFSAIPLGYGTGIREPLAS